MKTHNLTLFFILFALLSAQSVLAQTPSAINYQGVMRNQDGSPISEADITIRISILDDGPSGAVAYSETHEVTTNQFGLYRLSIGDGEAQEAGLHVVDWSQGNKWLQVECDEGLGFQTMGIQELLSVPYALYAEKSGSGLQAGEGIRIENNTIVNQSKDQTVTLNKGSDNVTISGNYPNFSIKVEDGDTSPNNEIQNLSYRYLSGAKHEITITNGVGVQVEERQGLKNVLSKNNDAGDVKIIGLASPTDTDGTSTAATKGYVDTEIAKATTHYAFKELLGLTASSDLQITEVIDENNVMTGDMFTAKEAGIYLFNINAASDASTIVTGITLEINGGAKTEEVLVMPGQTNGERIFVGQFMLNLNASDQVQLQVNIVGGAGFTGTFFGHKL